MLLFDHIMVTLIEDHVSENIKAIKRILLQNIWKNIYNQYINRTLRSVTCPCYVLPNQIY